MPERSEGVSIGRQHERPSVPLWPEQDPNATKAFWRVTAQVLQGPHQNNSQTREVDTGQMRNQYGVYLGGLGSKYVLSS